MIYFTFKIYGHLDEDCNEIYILIIKGKNEGWAKIKRRKRQYINLDINFGIVYWGLWLEFSYGLNLVIDVKRLGSYLRII